MSHWVDGYSIDYPETNQRGDGLDIGQINCARADHMIQEAVDPETGQTQAVTKRFRWNGQLVSTREWRGGFDEDGNEVLPVRAGVCQACWNESKNNDLYANCTLHGTNRKVQGLDGCPICALSPKERKAKVEAERKEAEILQALPEDGEAEEAGEHNATAPNTVVAGGLDLAVRKAVLAKRVAGTRQIVIAR